MFLEAFGSPPSVSGTDVLLLLSMHFGLTAVNRCASFPRGWAVFLEAFWEPTNCARQIDTEPGHIAVLLFSVHSGLTAVISKRIFPARLGYVFWKRPGAHQLWRKNRHWNWILILSSSFWGHSGLTAVIAMRTIPARLGCLWKLVGAQQLCRTNPDTSNVLFSMCSSLTLCRTVDAGPRY